MIESNLFKDMLLPAICVVFTIIGVLIGVCSLCDIANYYLSKSYCVVHVENNKVYEGKCHFLTISSVGQNGNSKHLQIYGDILKFRVEKEYLNENIKISSKP